MTEWRRIVSVLAFRCSLAAVAGIVIAVIVLGILFGIRL